MAWNYTPHQARAFLLLGERRDRKKSARMLRATAMATRSDFKDINQEIRKDWDD